MNKLWIFGDSMSRNHNKQVLNSSKELLWPQIVANNLDLELVNKALNGVGNDTIIKLLCNSLWEIESGDVVIIGLTNPIRHSLYINGLEEKMPFFLDYRKGDDSKLLKTLSYYQDNIIIQAHDKLLKDYYNQVFNIQKALTKQKIQSLIWSWYDQGNDSNKVNFNYSRVPDSHFSYKGHEQFGNRILFQLKNKVTHWKDIFELIGNRI